MMSTMSTKKRRTTAENGGGDAVALRAQVASLQSELAAVKGYGLRSSMPYYASEDALVSLEEKKNVFPAISRPAAHIKEMILQEHELDFKPRLNTSSYVNVVFEPEEEEVAMLGATVNIADASVYPASIKIHDTVVGMLGDLWNVPGAKAGVDVSGAGTVGSTEACLLAGLAHKFRWRKWYAARHNLSAEAVVGVQPNMVISSCFQAAWEKFFKYFDVTPRFVKPRLSNNFAVDAKELVAQCDEKTIAVVGILGNHYNGAYDPIWDIDREIAKLNAQKGFQIGIHVDGASGGFIAPFQDDMPPFDFRLSNVLSISASGHKFGQSICGTGWVVFRQRVDLTEHISISVSYLGGQCDSMTLNFSRPASGPYVQLYKFLRLGRPGYRTLVDNQMAVSATLRAALREMKDASGKPRFQILDEGDEKCLPVVAARLNPAGAYSFDDIDLQHALSESHWYVSGYKLNFHDFVANETVPLFQDEKGSATMFRVVVKANLTQVLAEDLVQQIRSTLYHSRQYVVGILFGRFGEEEKGGWVFGWHWKTRLLKQVTRSISDAHRARTLHYIATYYCDSDSC